MYILFQCESFKAVGAEVMQTPCDVVQAADITFSCVADPQASKDVSNKHSFAKYSKIIHLLACVKNIF